MKSALMGEGLRREIEMALPQHVSVSRFQRVLVTSVLHDDRLAAVDPMKVIKAALKIAPLGLLTDPILGEAYLIADSRGEVQVRIGYRGLLKLARQSKEIASIYAHEVYENDEIDCLLGDQKKLHHKPNLFGERGEVVGYYAVVRYTNGETDFEPMTTEQIDAIRDRSDGWKAFKANRIKDTPWASSYDEMAKKTCLRRLLKRLPTSADLADALIHEGEQDQREYRGSDNARDITPAGRTAASRRAAMAAVQSVEIVDEDGEVHYIPPGAAEQFLRDNPGAHRAGEEPHQAPAPVPSTLLHDDPPSPPAAPAAAPGNGNGDGPRKIRIWLGPLAQIEVPAAEALGELRAAIENVDSVAELNALTENNGPLLRALKGANLERMATAIDDTRRRLDEPPDDSWMLGDEPPTAEVR